MHLRSKFLPRINIRNEAVLAQQNESLIVLGQSTRNSGKDNSEIPNVTMPKQNSFARVRYERNNHKSVTIDDSLPKNSKNKRSLLFEEEKRRDNIDELAMHQI